MMNTVKCFIEMFGVEEYQISERTKIFELTSSLAPNHIPSFDSIKDFVESVPSRDVCTISLSTIIEDTLTLSNSQLQEGCYNDFISSLEDYTDTINIYLSIEKTIANNTLSIYNFDEFSKVLLEKPRMDIMKVFSLLLQNLDYIVFELYDSDILFSTNTMLFKSSGQSLAIKTFSRLKKVSACKDISYFYNLSSFSLIPDDFKIENTFEGNPFEKIFGELESVISLIYLSSTSSLECGMLKGQICGQRNVDFEYSIDTEFKHNEELYKIYNWVYTEGNIVDKAIIARNIISLHCKFTSLLDTDEKTYASIQSNFKLYSKDNAAQYIELKNKLAEFICEVIARVGDNATALLGNFKANLIAIFGFLFSVVLVNIVSEQPLNSIFTKEITAIMELILCGSFIYLVICVIEINYKLSKTVESYNILKQNYNAILSESDLEEAFGRDALIESVKKTVKNGIRNYSIAWLLFLLISFITIECISEAPIILSLFQCLISLFK